MGLRRGAACYLCHGSYMVVKKLQLLELEGIDSEQTWVNRAQNRCIRLIMLGRLGTTPSS